MRNASLILLVLVLIGGAAAGPTAHLRGADGTWSELPVRQDDGRVVVSIGLGEAPGGKATLVINKPEWMELDDTEPPMLMSVQVGDEGVSVTEAGIDLGTFDAKVPPICVRALDAHNPISPSGLRLALQGLPAGTAVDSSEAGPPEKSARFIVSLPELLPGRYSGELVVSDMSPQANELRVPCSLSVFGANIGEDGSGISLSSGTAAYRVSTGAKLPIVIGDTGLEAYVTGQVASSWMYPWQITDAQMIEETADRKVVRMSANLGDATGKAIDVTGKYEYDLEVRRGLPCLLVRSRLFNEVADGDVYQFWGWIAGDGYDTSKGHSDWTMNYTEIGKVGWVYLPSSNAEKPGVGWISPLSFGESRFANMLLYTSPTKIATKKGDSVEMQFAIMPASSPEQVAQVAEKINELGIW